MFERNNCNPVVSRQIISTNFHTCLFIKGTVKETNRDIQSNYGMTMNKLL